jgi:putative polyhydroxyalkanoate system protein
MAHVDVRKPHSLGADGARRAAEQVLEELRHEHGFRLDTRWEGDTLHAQGRGFEAWLETSDHEVRVTARLGLLLRPLRGTVEREVREYLDRYLTGNVAAG